MHVQPTISAVRHQIATAIASRWLAMNMLGWSSLHALPRRFGDFPIDPQRFAIFVEGGLFEHIRVARQLILDALAEEFNLRSARSQRSAGDIDMKRAGVSEADTLIGNFFEAAHRDPR